MIDFTVCREQSPNKQFKRDSARVAFLVCGCFGVEVKKQDSHIFLIKKQDSHIFLMFRPALTRL